MPSNSRLSSSRSASASAASVRRSRSTLIAAGDRMRTNTARVRVCRGGSASRMMLAGRHGVSFRKSLRPTPAPEQ